MRSLLAYWIGGAESTAASAIVAPPSLFRIFHAPASDLGAVLFRSQSMLIDSVDSIDALIDIDSLQTAQQASIFRVSLAANPSMFRRRLIDAVVLIDAVIDLDTLQEPS